MQKVNEMKILYHLFAGNLFLHLIFNIVVQGNINELISEKYVILRKNVPIFK